MKLGMYEWLNYLYFLFFLKTLSLDVCSNHSKKKLFNNWEENIMHPRMERMRRIICAVNFMKFDKSIKNEELRRQIVR